MRIEITKSDNQITFEADTPTTYPEVLNVLLTIIYNEMINIVEREPEAKEQVFDITNEAFSECLARFAPDIDLRPDFDHDAILEHSTTRALDHALSKL